MPIEQPGAAGALIPTLQPPISADAQLAAALSASPPTPATADPPVPFGRGWAFDFLNSRFIRYGSSPAIASGLDNLRMWIEKTLRTKRFAHPIYSNQYGMQLPREIIEARFDGELTAEYAQAITEALLVHDRIQKVRDFAFNFDDADGILAVRFTVVLDVAGRALEVTTPLTVRAAV